MCTVIMCCQLMWHLYDFVKTCSLWVSMMLMAEPSVLWRCWFVDGKGIQPVKELGCWFYIDDDDDMTEACITWSSSFYHCPPPASDATVKTRGLFDIPVLALPDCHGNWPWKQVCCMCVSVLMDYLWPLFLHIQGEVCGVGTAWSSSVECGHC